MVCNMLESIWASPIYPLGEGLGFRILGLRAEAF